MLSKEQLDFYSQNGYLLLDGVFTADEIEECSFEYDKLFKAKESQNNLEATWKGDWAAPATDSLKVISMAMSRRKNEFQILRFSGAINP